MHKKSVSSSAAGRGRRPGRAPIQPPSFLNLLFGVTVFLSAFLLFQVQPIISKAILPWFGGTPAVWTTAMFFFQVALLAGYCYAHLTTRFLSAAAQKWLHLAFCLVAVLLLPIGLAESAKPIGQVAHPSSTVLMLLFRSVGVPFLLLSTTAPLVQVWWHRTFTSTPYKLYAVSNAGSLLALLSYPFVVEPYIGLQRQMVWWSTVFLAVTCSIAYGSYRVGASQQALANRESEEEVSKPTWRAIALWLALSACGSVLLLAMTNHITQNVAVIPFLWVAPLSIYLLSFILSFSDRGYYRRSIYGVLMILSYMAAAYVYNAFGVTDNLALILTIHLVALLAGCMVCHGELANARPHARYLTGFFVITAAGGAVGGFLVSIVAPFLFSSYHEYPLVLIGCVVLLLSISARDEQSRLCLLKSKRGSRTALYWLGATICCFVFLVCLRNALVNNLVYSVLSRRNFYGVLSVLPFKEGGQDYVELRHGQIVHGVQNLDPEQQAEPTLYYSRDSGLGIAMQLMDQKDRPKRVGMLGLGIGTIAAYGNQGDVFRVYEINQDVIDIGTDPSVFTYWSLLQQRGAVGEVVVGDAKLSLDAELREGTPQNFDVMVLDVFSGDAIPVHLMTLSAFQTYVQHLAPDGLLAVHISNRHLDLLPVVHSVADRLSLQASFTSTKQSDWMMLGSPNAILNLKRSQPDQVNVLPKPKVDRTWTDDFSNIFKILK